MVVNTEKNFPIRLATADGHACQTKLIQFGSIFVLCCRFGKQYCQNGNKNFCIKLELSTRCVTPCIIQVETLIHPATSLLPISFAVRLQVHLNLEGVGFGKYRQFS